jgi:hypothetical protein
LLQQAGIDLQAQQLSTEARHLTTLIVQQHLTVAQALETVPHIALREKLRPLMYIAHLSAAVVALQQAGGLTREQAEDLCRFLQMMSTV